MLRKLLGKSGRRILRAIKKLSTRRLKAKRSPRFDLWRATMPDPDEASLSWSLPSLDARSIDTYMTYVPENAEECAEDCCRCDEYEENQRNENIENEMII